MKRKKTILLIAASIAAILAAELLLRLILSPTFDEPAGIFHADGQQPYAFPDNDYVRQTMGKTPVQFRPYHFALNKRGQYRIIIIGDSQPYGAYLPNSLSLSAILEQHLGSLDKSTEYKVINLSLPGTDPLHQMHILDSAVKYRPHLIIHQTGIDSGTTTLEYWRIMPFSSGLLHGLRLLFAPAGTPSPGQFGGAFAGPAGREAATHDRYIQQLENMYKIFHDERMPVLSLLPVYSRHALQAQQQKVDAIRSAIGRICTAYSIKSIDLQTTMHTNQLTRDPFIDTLHLLPEGNLLFADRIARHILPGANHHPLRLPPVPPVPKLVLELNARALAMDPRALNPVNLSVFTSFYKFVRRDNAVLLVPRTDAPLGLEIITNTPPFAEAGSVYMALAAGALSRKADDLKSAGAMFTLALQENPLDYKAANNLALLESILGDRRQALRQLLLLYYRGITDRGFLQNLGVMLHTLQQQQALTELGTLFRKRGIRPATSLTYLW